MNTGEYVIAIYLRLSQEDENLGESESIANQRDLIHSFIKNEPDFSGCRIIEFVDDGYSGTNFNRPGVTEMLNMAGKGGINCIIVKDFSRFGRNFIETGDYIEQIFPFLGIRFIAVNNNFDTKGTLSTGSLETAFKNLINDLYSRDISKKVRSAKRTKMQKGHFMSSREIFGYRKSAENRNVLVVDPVAANYIKLIFRLCLEGRGTTSIAAKLNKDGIPTPLIYKNGIGQGRKWNVVGEENKWTGAAVLRILRDERYTGALISGKRKAVKPGSRKSVKVPAKDWIVVPDAHEPIISREEFMTTQQCIGQKNERDCFSINPHMFSKKIKCGHCGHVLRRRDGNEPYFFCDTPKISDSECSTKKIPEKLICDIVLNAIRKYSEVFLCVETLLNDFNRKADNKARDTKYQLNVLKNEIEKTKTLKIKFYEDFKDGRMSKEIYLRERERCGENILETTNRIENLNYELERLRDRPDRQHLVIPELSPQLITGLISEIYVYSLEMIEIEWNFSEKIFVLS